MQNHTQKSGFIAVLGRPNAGKSSLLNFVVGERINLVSHKANATRKRQNTIAMFEDNQLIFVDTPGLHEKERELNRFMLKEAIKALGDCDIAIFLAPAVDGVEHYEKFLELGGDKKPHILLLTKIDQVSNDKILKKIEEYKKFQDKFLALIPFTIQKDGFRNELLRVLSKYLPVHPYYYDPEFLTTQNMKDIYKEFIREAVFEFTSDEVPYFADVMVEKVEEFPNMDKVYAKIIVEKESQKGIIIGKNGATMKRIGTQARKSMEELSGKKVFLGLLTIVKPGWTQDKKEMEKMGYKLD